MVGKGNLAVFEGSNISETEEATPTKIDVHALDINPYMHKFFEQFCDNSLTVTIITIFSLLLLEKQKE